MKVNGPGKRKKDKEDIMALTKHIWLNSDLLLLLREIIRQLWGFNRGDLNISASAVPNNKDTFKTNRNGKLQHIKLFKQ